MSNYIDFSNFTDSEILRMQKEKKKEYIILIQSEKIAKILLNYFGESLYTTNYHYRVNTEYYLLYERVAKKKIVSDEIFEDSVIRIPISSVISRLEESGKELQKINKSLYPSYSLIISQIIDIIKDLDIVIIYQDGDLKIDKDGDMVLVNDEEIKNLLIKGKRKTLI